MSNWDRFWIRLFVVLMILHVTISHQSIRNHIPAARKKVATPAPYADESFIKAIREGKEWRGTIGKADVFVLPRAEYPRGEDKGTSE